MVLQQVKWHCHCCGLGSIPGQGTSACYAGSPKEKKEKNFFQEKNIEIHLLKLEKREFPLWLSG